MRETVRRGFQVLTEMDPAHFSTVANFNSLEKGRHSAFYFVNGKRQKQISSAVNDIFKN